MDAPHPLKALLQLQLASDAYAVRHLPYVLASLTSTCFLPSPHTQKWTTRIHSLMHSKDPGARWAGLCIAYQTSLFSKSIMIECAQNWLGVALPTLSRNEPGPTLKASIRLLSHIFISTTDVPEFQRQLATPNVPKFSLALIVLAERLDGQEVGILSLAVLTRLIPLYPTLHRAQHAGLQSLSLKFLNGGLHSPTDPGLLKAASRLYSVLHFTGGKVGAVNLWRKSVDETLAFAWSALLSLRTTFPNDGRSPASNQPERLAGDPIVWVQRNLDRLRCGVVILSDLMRSVTPRPVQLPIGALVKFTIQLLSSTADERVDGHVDATVRVMEVSALSSIWKHGCELLICLAKCARHHLTPSQTRLTTCIIYHLEQPITSSERLQFLNAVEAVLIYCQPLHSSLLSTRLAKAILPSLTVVIATQPEVQHTDEPAGSSSAGKNKKSKKRARGYEGDEVFKATRGIICPTEEDGQVLLAALNGIRLVLRSPHLAPAIHSITCRVLLSMLLVLPQMSPPSLSPDPTLHGRVLARVHEICLELSSGTTSVMSKSLGFVIQASIIDGSEHALVSSQGVRQKLELLLHPRVPPLIRSLPHVESLSLFRAEESLDEIDTREALGLGVTEQHPKALDSTDNVTLAPPYHEEMNAQQSPTHPGTVEGSDISNQPSPSAQPILQAKFAEPASTSLLPPAPSHLTSLSLTKTSPTPSSIIPAIVQPAPEVVPMDEDEEDEVMPTIDMSSDSDFDQSAV